MNRPGTWCDVAPQVLVYCHEGWILAETRTGWPIWRMREPELGGSLYLRCAVHGVAVYAIVQGHDTGHAYFTEGVQWQDYGPSFGQNAVLVRLTPEGLRYWIQRSATTYSTRLRYQLFEDVVTMPETSQGFLDWTEDRGLLLTDPNRVDGDLVLPNYAGALTVGQDATEDGLYGRFQGRTLRLSGRRPAYEPHCCEERPGGHWVACARSTNGRFIVCKVGKRRWRTEG